MFCNWILRDPNFTALFIQFKVIAFSLFFSVVQGPIIVKMGLICHWANSKSCFTGTFHVFVIVAFLYICSTTYIYCLYKGEDVLSCKTCIWSYCHVFGQWNMFKLTFYWITDPLIKFIIKLYRNRMVD